MKDRRFVISNGTVAVSTNDRHHALKLVAATKGADLVDTKPEPKYPWLREDIAAAKE